VVGGCVGVRGIFEAVEPGFEGAGPFLECGEATFAESEQVGDVTVEFMVLSYGGLAGAVGWLGLGQGGSEEEPGDGFPGEFSGGEDERQGAFASALEVGDGGGGAPEAACEVCLSADRLENSPGGGVFIERVRQLRNSLFLDTQS
jgi:hypothetical protein